MLGRLAISALHHQKEWLCLQGSIAFTLGGKKGLGWFLLDCGRVFCDLVT